MLRDGAVISSRRVADTSCGGLVRGMAGRSVEQPYYPYYKESVPTGETLLEVRDLSDPGFQNISLTLKRSEIVERAVWQGGGFSGGERRREKSATRTQDPELGTRNSALTLLQRGCPRASSHFLTPLQGCLHVRVSLCYACAQVVIKIQGLRSVRFYRGLRLLHH